MASNGEQATNRHSMPTDGSSVSGRGNFSERRLGEAAATLDMPCEELLAALTSARRHHASSVATFAADADLTLAEPSYSPNQLPSSDIFTPTVVNSPIAPGTFQGNHLPGADIWLQHSERLAHLFHEDLDGGPQSLQPGFVNSSGTAVGSVAQGGWDYSVPNSSFGNLYGADGNLINNVEGGSTSALWSAEPSSQPSQHVFVGNASRIGHEYSVLLGQEEPLREMDIRQMQSNAHQMQIPFRQNAWGQNQDLGTHHFTSASSTALSVVSFADAAARGNAVTIQGSSTVLGPDSGALWEEGEILVPSEFAGSAEISLTWDSGSLPVPHTESVTSTEVSGLRGNTSSANPRSSIHQTSPLPLLAKGATKSPSVVSSGDFSLVVLTPPEGHPSSSNSVSPPEEFYALHSAMTEKQGPCSKVWTLGPRRKNQKRTTKNANHDSGTKASSQRRRRPFASKELREATALTRQNKACLRCRMQKIRCDADPNDPEGECMTCRKLSRPTMSGLPCVRCIITDAPLYREQDAPFQLFSRRWQSMDIVDITEWASDEVRTIELTQVFLDEPVPYSVEVRRFVPAEGDMLEEKWSDGQVSKTHKIPPYGLADMKKTAQHMKRFLHDSIYMYILHTVGKVGSEELLWQTYLTAFQHSHEAPTEEERTLLDKCLFLWVACRKTSNPERICGADKLGVDPVEDPASPWFKHMPMPPVIIAQMECIIYTEILRPLSKAVLHRLQVLIKANKRTYWFTIYLTNFILLHSCSMLTRRDWEYARQMSLPTEFANPSSIKEHHLGAVKMLAHFHYINKGDLPFKSALTVNGLYEVSRDAGLSPSQSEFVRQTALMVKEKALRGQVEAFSDCMIVSKCLRSKRKDKESCSASELSEEAKQSTTWTRLQRERANLGRASHTKDLSILSWGHDIPEGAPLSIIIFEDSGPSQPQRGGKLPVQRLVVQPKANEMARSIAIILKGFTAVQNP